MNAPGALWLSAALTMLLSLGASADTTDQDTLSVAKAQLVEAYAQTARPKQDRQSPKTIYLAQLERIADAELEPEPNAFPDRSIENALVDIAAHRAARLAEFETLEQTLSQPPPRSDRRSRKPLWERVIPRPSPQTPEDRDNTRILWEHAVLLPAEQAGAKEYAFSVLVNLDDPRSIPVFLHHFDLITGQPVHLIDGGCSERLQQEALRAVVALATSHGQQGEALPLLMARVDQAAEWGVRVKQSLRPGQRHAIRAEDIVPSIIDSAEVQGFGDRAKEMRAAWAAAARAQPLPDDPHLLSYKLVEQMRNLQPESADAEQH